ncbi:hypothetical protein EON65_58695 [archaeon]|nr:MAG: hypothetical protein EON65_58695 [archaeon]
MKLIQSLIAAVMSVILVQSFALLSPCHIGKEVVRSLSTRRWDSSFDKTPSRPVGKSNAPRSYDYNPRYQDTEYKPRDRSNRSFRERGSEGYAPREDRRTYSNYKPPFSRDKPYPNQSYRSERSSYGDRVDKEPMFGAYDGDHLYGINPIYLALQARRRKFATLFVQEEMKLSQKKDSKAAESIMKMAEEYGVEMQYTGVCGEHFHLPIRACIHIYMVYDNIFLYYYKLPHTAALIIGKVAK